MLFAAAAMVRGTAGPVAQRAPARLRTMRCSARCCRRGCGARQLADPVEVADEGDHRNNLATALQAEGTAAEATDHYRRAIALEPEYAPPTTTSATELAVGQIDAAIATYEKALRDAATSRTPTTTWPTRCSKGQRREAAEHFRIALQSIPARPVPQQPGDRAVPGPGDDAIAAFRAAVARTDVGAGAPQSRNALLVAARPMKRSRNSKRSQLDPHDADALRLGSVLLEADARRSDRRIPCRASA